MQYALLIYLDPDTGSDLSEDERRAVTAEYLDDPRRTRG